MKKLDSQILKEIIQPRPLKSHKGNYGRVLTIGGNLNYGGAIIMSTRAAVYAGAGLTTCATVTENLTALHTIVPEAMFIALQDKDLLKTALQKASVIVIGPGLGLTSRATELLKNVLNLINEKQFLIIDGSALTILSQNNDLLKLFTGKKIILTPHQMEWQRISQIPINQQTDPQNIAFQQQINATVVLKKHGTVIYHLDGSQSLLSVGGPYMATGGMGDTLTGIIAAFLGQFHDKDYDKLVDAAVYTHSALAEELSQSNYVVLPSILTSSLPAFMAKYSTLQQ